MQTCNSMKSTSETYFIKDGFAPMSVPVSHDSEPAHAITRLWK